MCPYCELRSKQTSYVYKHVRQKHEGAEVYSVDVLVEPHVNWYPNRMKNFDVQ